MSDVSPRIVDWLSSVIELLRVPMTTMPKQTILGRLRDCYDSTAASWNWRDRDGAFGMIIAPEEIALARPTPGACPSGALSDRQPLITWFTVDQDPPWPTGSPVAGTAVPRSPRRSTDRRLIQLGMEQQLSIPYRLDGNMFRTFVVARGGKDYSDDDLTLARHIQQSLITVDQQIRALARLSAERGPADPAEAFDLTGRELAVLQLLAEGRTTRCSARQLNCSPRTVEKHLERCFRKLGVRDRLNAVRVATQAGLVGHSQGADSPSLS